MDNLPKSFSTAVLWNGVPLRDYNGNSITTIQFSQVVSALRVVYRTANSVVVGIKILRLVVDIDIITARDIVKDLIPYFNLQNGKCL